MALMGLQGLSPLGGGSSYGMGQPPNGDGTDPNDPNKPKAPPSGAPSSSQSAPPNYAPQQQQTFAEMSQQGRARPAPPMQQNGGLMGQTQQSASQALANPSAYGAPQVQQSIDALNQNLAVQDTLGKQQIDQTMAGRGLYDSTEAGRQYGMLAQQESAQRAQLAANLSTQVAQTYGQDRSTAIQNALSAQGQQFGQGLSQQQLQLQQALGYGGLGLQAQQQQQNFALGSGSLTGNFGGQSTLAAQQQAIQNQQFQQNFGLQSQLGLGGLGVQQQQANTQQAGTLGNLALGQQQLGQQASQFGQSFGLQSLENQQQYGLSQQQMALQQALGYGNLGVSQQQANTQQQQVQGQLGLGQGQLSLAQLQNSQQYGVSQEQLAQQQAYQSGQLGLGQQQVNASLLNEQRQVLGNLAYAGIVNSTPDHLNTPSSDWMNFLLSSQGQNPGSPYQLPPWAWNGAPGQQQTGGQVPSGGGGQIGAPGQLSPTYSFDPSRFTFSPSAPPNGANGPGGTSIPPTLTPPPGPPPGSPGTAGAPPDGSTGLPSGMSPQLAAMFGYTTSDGQTPLIGSQNMAPGQTQQQAASQYQQRAAQAYQQQIGGMPLTTPGLSDSQFNTILGNQYQQWLRATGGNQQQAAQELSQWVNSQPLGPNRESINSSDPRVQSFLKTLGYSQ